MASTRKEYSDLINRSEFGAAQSLIYGAPMTLFHGTPSPLDKKPQKLAVIDRKIDETSAVGSVDSSSRPDTKSHAKK